MPGIGTITAAQQAIESIIFQPRGQQENHLLDRYVLAILNRPANLTLQAAHNNFLTTLRNDQRIPQHIRVATELRLNRILGLFNQLRANRTAARQIPGSLEDTEQGRQLQQQYLQTTGILRRIVSQGAFGELLIHADGPIRTVPSQP